MNSFHKLENLKKEISINPNIDLLNEINKIAEDEFNAARQANPNYNIEDYFIDVYRVFGDNVLLDASIVGYSNPSIYIDFNRVFERIRRSKNAKGLPPASHGFF